MDDVDNKEKARSAMRRESITPKTRSNVSSRATSNGMNIFQRVTLFFGALTLPANAYAAPKNFKVSGKNYITEFPYVLNFSFYDKFVKRDNFKNIIELDL